MALSGYKVVISFLAILGTTNILCASQHIADNGKYLKGESIMDLLGDPDTPNIPYHGKYNPRSHQNIAENGEYLKSESIMDLLGDPDTPYIPYYGKYNPRSHQNHPANGAFSYMRGLAIGQYMGDPDQIYIRINDGLMRNRLHNGRIVPGVFWLGSNYRRNASPLEEAYDGVSHPAALEQNGDVWASNAHYSHLPHPAIQVFEV